MQLILDMGSGKSTHNDVDYVDAMIQSVIDIDSKKHEVVFKFQLFKNAPPNEPLDPLVFNEAYMFATKRGYKCTASVFDLESLKFLLNFQVPFVKIACRTDLYWLIGEVPRKIPVYASCTPDGNQSVPFFPNLWMQCVPEYPAEVSAYTKAMAYSDHTVGFELFKRSPLFIEKHFVMEREEDNPDSGPFAVTPSELKEIM